MFGRRGRLDLLQAVAGEIGLWFRCSALDAGFNPADTGHRLLGPPALGGIVRYLGEVSLGLGRMTRYRVMRCGLPQSVCRR
jgi:hypothetical protein